MFPQLTSWLAEKDHKAGFKVRIRQNPQKEMFVCVTSSESDASDWFSDRSVLAVHTHQHKHVPPPQKNNTDTGLYSVDVQQQTLYLWSHLV